MSTEEKKAESLVAAVAPANTDGTEGSASGKIQFTMEATEFQGKLRITTISSMVPGSLYAQVYQNGFPGNPNTGYTKAHLIKNHTDVWDTGLVWGSGYGCALILSTYDSQYQYQYVCKLTT